MAQSPPTENGRTAPPYVSASTFWAFLNGLKHSIPTRIDRSLMRALSGSGQAQLLHALKYFGLMLEDGTVTTSLENLIRSEGEDRKNAVNALLVANYRFLAPDSPFDLSKATSGEFQEQFRLLGAEGETGKKCRRFFIDLATEAGLSISPHIKPSGPATGSASPRKKTARRKPRADSPTVAPPIAQHTSVNTGIDPTVAAILQKIPDLDLTADSEARKDWLAAIQIIKEIGDAKSTGPSKPQDVEAPPKGDPK